METFQCPQCPSKGHPKSRFDLNSRTFYCGQCRKTSQLADERVSATQEKNSFAINEFEKGHFNEAKEMSLHTIELAYNYTPAHYMISYHKEVIGKEYDTISAFFKDSLKRDQISASECRDLMRLFIKSPKILLDFENEMITLLTSALGGDIDSDPELLADMEKFFEQILPYLIANRSSHTDLVTKKQVRNLDDNDSDNQPASIMDRYLEITEVFDLPKTCYALYNAIAKLPDSPCVDNSFFLKTKTQNFYNNFVLPTGDIIKTMKNPENRAKFSAAYDKRRLQFETLMNNA